MTTARRYAAPDALAAGIIDRAVDEDSVRRTAVEIAASQIGKAGPVLATIKTRMYATALDALRDRQNPLD
jgi:enoyl-CoA hydratase/carnithine racemase